MSTSDALDDGSYDAFIVWAEAREDGRVTFDLAITTGARKGETLSVTGPTHRDPLDLVGLPCTLLVEGGSPRVEL
jgi:hypothetical protein